MKFFLKENPASPFIVSGAIVPFVLHGNEGYLALEDNDKLVPALEQAIKLSKGGIVAITQAMFDQKKNLPPAKNLRPNSPWQQPLRVMPQQSSVKKPAKPSVPVAAVGKLVDTAVANKLREMGIKIPGEQQTLPMPPVVQEAIERLGKEGKSESAPRPATKRVDVKEISANVAPA